MKVQNMTSTSGNKVANQFIIEANGRTAFQSYDSVIAEKRKKLVTEGIYDETGKCIDTRTTAKTVVYLDSTYWDYSVTTGKYRNQFLGETKKETERKIASGEYILTDLNS